MQQSHASPLTTEQAAVVERARMALEAAKAETDWTPGALAAHLGTVRWELSEVLFVVGQLTGQPTAQDDAGRAIVADLDEQLTADDYRLPGAGVTR